MWTVDNDILHRNYVTIKLYLLTPMDRTTLPHAKSTISRCTLSVITRQRSSADGKFLYKPTAYRY